MRRSTAGSSIRRMRYFGFSFIPVTAVVLAVAPAAVPDGHGDRPDPRRSGVRSVACRARARVPIAARHIAGLRGVARRRPSRAARPMKVVVTGGAGFIGSNLVDALLADGHTVTAVDNLSTGRIASSSTGADEPDRFDLVELDLTTDRDRLADVVRGADAVVHLAANADVRFGWNAPRRDLEQNVVAHAERARGDAGDRRAADPVLLDRFGLRRDRRSSRHRRTRRSRSRRRCTARRRRPPRATSRRTPRPGSLSATVFRFVSILGPRYTHGHVIDFVAQLHADPTQLHVLGDGTQRKSYLDVADCVAALRVTAGAQQPRFEVFNLGVDDYCTVRDSIGWITDRLGVAPKLEFGEGDRGWVGDNPFIFLDTARIRATGWTPRHSIRTAVERTVDYLLANEWLLEAHDPAGAASDGSPTHLVTLDQPHARHPRSTPMTTFSERFLARDDRHPRAAIDAGDLEAWSSVMVASRDRGGRLFFCGSGGGAGHASHATCDFRKLGGFEAYCVTDNVSELTARVNDDGWDTAYSNWLRASRFGADDCLFVFSVGGGSIEPPVSRNLVSCMELAKEVGRQHRRRRRARRRWHRGQLADRLRDHRRPSTRAGHAADRGLPGPHLAPDRVASDRWPVDRQVGGHPHGDAGARETEVLSAMAGHRSPYRVGSRRRARHRRAVAGGSPQRAPTWCWSRTATRRGAPRGRRSTGSTRRALARRVRRGRPATASDMLPIRRARALARVRSPRRRQRRRPAGRSSPTPTQYGWSRLRPRQINVGGTSNLVPVLPSRRMTATGACAHASSRSPGAASAARTRPSGSAPTSPRRPRSVVLTEVVARAAAAACHHQRHRPRPGPHRLHGRGASRRPGRGRSTALHASQSAAAPDLRAAARARALPGERIGRLAHRALLAAALGIRPAALADSRCDRAIALPAAPHRRRPLR